MDKGHSIFSNTEISRTLPQDGISIIFDEMVRTGQAEYFDGTKKDRFVFVFLKKCMFF
jgi:hypothetical protein